jgi:UDP-galactopyranose mutase
MKKSLVHIIGGGISGCSLAYFLSDSFQVILHEKSSSLGDLLQTNVSVSGYSYVYNGICESSEWMIKFLTEISPTPLKKLEWNQSVDPLISLSTYSLPLSPSQFPVFWRETIALEQSKATHHYGDAANTLVNHFGDTLYHLIVKGMVERFWGYPIDNLDIQAAQQYIHPNNFTSILFPENGWEPIVSSLTKKCEVRYESNPLAHQLRDEIIICTDLPDLFTENQQKLQYTYASFETDEVAWEPTKPDVMWYANHVPWTKITQMGKLFNQTNNIIVRENRSAQDKIIHLAPTIFNKELIKSIINNRQDILFCGPMVSQQYLSIHDSIIEASRTASVIKQRYL